MLRMWKKNRETMEKTRSPEPSQLPTQNLLMRFLWALEHVGPILESEFFTTTERALTRVTRDHYRTWARRSLSRLYETAKNQRLGTPEDLINPAFLREYVSMLNQRYSSNARWLMLRFTVFWLHYLFPDRYPLVNLENLETMIHSSQDSLDFEESWEAIDPLFVEMNRDWIRRSYVPLNQICRASYGLTEPTSEPLIAKG